MTVCAIMSRRVKKEDEARSTWAEGCGGLCLAHENIQAS